jgi:hypothetical protein
MMMNAKRNSYISAAAALLLFCLPLAIVAQPSSKPISEKGLEDALKIGGLQPPELVSLIEKRGVDFFLNGEVEAQLRAAGATSAVIEAVRTHYRSADAAVPSGATGVSVPQPASNAGRSLPEAPGVYYKDGSSWVQLRPESVNWRHEGLMHNLTKDTGGLLHGELTGEVVGTHSPATMHSPASFLLRTTQGAMLQDYLLVHMHEKHDNRDFKVALSGASSGDAVDFRTARITENAYEVDFTQGAGEYAFMTRSVVPSGGDSSHSGQVLTFRILE